MDDVRLATEPDAVPTWDEIVDQHSDRVYRLAYRLTGNRPDAEDLTQEVFVRVFRSLSTYTPGTFEGWLHRITTNLFLDQARRKQRIRFDALTDERADRLTSALADARTRRTPTSGSTTTSSALCQALPPDFRAAVVLCDVEGLTYEEIAEILGAKLGTVRSRIHRGRALLRRALAHRAPASGRARYSGPLAAPLRPSGPSVTSPTKPFERALRAGGHASAGTPDDHRAPRRPRQRAARRPAVPGRGGAGLGARARLPPVPRPRRARGLGQDPAGRALLRRPRARRPPQGVAALVDGRRATSRRPLPRLRARPAAAPGLAGRPGWRRCRRGRDGGAGAGRRARRRPDRSTGARRRRRSPRRPRPGWTCTTAAPCRCPDLRVRHPSGAGFRRDREQWPL